MAHTKKMDESYFARLIKEFNAVGEMIRARQDEKQAVIDEFNSESKRFFFGKISERALASSVRKTNQEIHKLNKEIRSAISKANDIANQAKKFVSAQSPKTFNATLSGIVGRGSKKKTVKMKVKKTTVKKKSVKKKSVRVIKSVRKKELVLDKKFSKK